MSVGEVLAGAARWHVEQGDCRDMIASLPRASVPLVVTDPPYASGARRDADKAVRGSMLRSLDDEEWFSHDAMTTWGFSWFLRGILSDLREKLTIGAHVYVFSDWRQTPNVYGMLEACGYRVNHCLVWDKAHFGMGSYWRNQHENVIFASNGMPAPMLDRGMGSVLTCPTVSPAARVHPTEKPVALLSRIVDAVPGDLVLDPFTGSGGTGVAALRAGRRFIGSEVDPNHHATARAKLAAEERGLSLAAATAGQTSIFDRVKESA